MVLIFARSKVVLRSLGTQEGESMPAVPHDPVERYQRDRFLDDVNAAFAALRSDSEGWKEEQEERALWDATLNDELGKE